jgi:predicted PurR-regulated permease PerM
LSQRTDDEIGGADGEPRAPETAQSSARIGAAVSVLEDKMFLILLIAISVAFVCVLWPFFGGIFWATVLAILFAQLHRWLTTRMGQRRTPAALATVVIILLMVILPAAVIAAALVRESIGVYARIQSGELDFARMFDQVWAALPSWITSALQALGLTELGDLQLKLSEGLTKGLQFFATRAYSIGQNAFGFVVGFFVMLYLLFFLLRDGAALLGRMRDAIPLDEGVKLELGNKFAAVIRATVKGNVVVALAQGALGGLIFFLLGINAALLWAVLMAFLSLLPAVGSALVWFPAALYLLATGATWQGIVLVAYGVLVIGLVDNVLRPILVGKDTKMPDYVVLITTLGGMAIFGINGFVIGPVIAAMFIAVWHIVAVSRG